MSTLDVCWSALLQHLDETNLVKHRFEGGSLLVKVTCHDNFLELVRSKDPLLDDILNPVKDLILVNVFGVRVSRVVNIDEVDLYPFDEADFPPGKIVQAPDMFKIAEKARRTGPAPFFPRSLSLQGLESE